jgi:hypothetical protein
VQKAIVALHRLWSSARDPEIEWPGRTLPLRVGQRIEFRITVHDPIRLQTDVMDHRFGCPSSSGPGFVLPLARPASASVALTCRSRKSAPSPQPAPLIIDRPAILTSPFVSIAPLPTIVVYPTVRYYCIDLHYRALLITLLPQFASSSPTSSFGRTWRRPLSTAVIPSFICSSRRCISQRSSDRSFGTRPRRPYPPMLLLPDNLRRYTKHHARCLLHSI